MRIKFHGENEPPNSLKIAYLVCEKDLAAEVDGLSAEDALGMAEKLERWAVQCRKLACAMGKDDLLQN